MRNNRIGDNPALAAILKTAIKNSEKEYKTTQLQPKKKKIATRIVAKIIQKMDQSAASQAVQLALMNSIGANINTGAPLLQDASTWYTSTDIYNTTQLIDPYSAILALIILGIFLFVMHNTSYGRKLYAIGGNQEVARLAGYNIKRLK